MNVNCGERLRTYREKSGLSQTDVSKKLGVTRQCVSAWERNVTEPTIGDVNKLIVLYDCSIADILNPSANAMNNAILEAFNKADEQTKRIVLYALKLEEYL